MPALAITFKILRAEEWVPLATCLADLPGMVAYYLQVPGLHCCDIQGGFFIDVDGVPWSDDGTVDEFWMTMTWFAALAELWEGAAQAQACPWEESRLTLTRSDDLLELEDIHHSGHVAMPRVLVSLTDFTAQILRVSVPFVSFCAGLRAESARRIADGCAAEEAQKLGVLVENLPANVAQAVARVARAAGMDVRAGESGPG